MKTIRVLIAAEKGDNLKELIDIVSKESDMGLLDSIEEFTHLMKVLTMNPDVIILDQALFPREEIPVVLSKIKKKAHRAGTILLLKRDTDDKALMEALIDGVKGYIKKAEVPKYLTEAIRSVSEGDVWAERRILNKFLTGTPLIQKNIESKLKTIHNPLTKRETELIREVLKGTSNRDIARKYKITEMTVKTHLYRIYKKMKVKSRAQAIAYLIYP